MEKKVILLLDDELDILDLIEDNLRDSFAIAKFDDPEKALSFIERKKVDLAITDYRMPKCKGHEFIKAARSMKPDNPFPFIVYSAYITEAIPYLQGIPDTYTLSKPADQIKLKDAVEMILLV